MDQHRAGPDDDSHDGRGSGPEARPPEALTTSIDVSGDALTVRLPLVSAIAGLLGATGSSRGRPALRLRLHGHRYDEPLVSHSDAAALAARITPPTDSAIPGKGSHG